MIETGFDRRVKIQQVIQNQLPEFLLSESPKTSDFLKQYYISQEYQGGPVDIAENLDQYIKVDNLTQEVIKGETLLSSDITSSSDVITVSSTKGFPNEYGLIKIDDEIITYTGITANSFTGCIRGFSGITNLQNTNNPEELVFSTSSAASHTANASVKNLSSLFLQEFFNKIKYTFAPGLEKVSFTQDLDVSNFIKNARSLYQTKGTEESFKILFKVLYNEDVKVVDLENFLTKPSYSNFSRREVIIAERISGNPLSLVGQTIKKVLDEKTQGSVSEVEILSRNGKTYYKISLFIGYNENDLTEGTFSITGATRVIGSVPVGSSIITVDSTIGFPDSGILVSGSNKITYSSKSINQFFGCTGVTTTITTSSLIRSDDIAYGYEDGDTTKRVEIRITGALSEFVPVGDINLASEGQTIGVKHLGEKIKNPFSDKTFKEIFANSWIYNTSSRYQISNISGSTFTLLSEIDKSSLKVGDSVDILARGTQNSVVSNAIVTNINSANKQIILSGTGSFVPSVSLDYDLRRNLEKATSTGASLEYGNNVVFSNIQNVYTDEKYAYVASNSLPSYDISENIIEASISEANGSRLQGLNSITLRYSIISFSSAVPFITGDKVVYFPETTSMPGLIAGNTYYVEVLSLNNQIRLYSSRSFIGSSEYLQFGDLSSGTGFHKFVLFEHKDLVISPQKLLRRFPLDRNYFTGSVQETKSGPVGILINGVEVVSPKSADKIYYGPLDKISVFNGGSGYDVINPPKIEVTPPNSGTTALINPVVSGEVSKVFVDPQDFDIDKVISVSMTGGNGSGAIFKPVIIQRFREVNFDARQTFNGGGIDISDETITFETDHNFTNGQTVIYSNNGNASVGIGTFGPPDNIFNRVQNKTLVNGSEYYVQIVNTSTVKLYGTYNDYYAGINTVGFTTENLNGIHKFKTIAKNTLKDIRVLNPGSGYQNRKLYVKPSNVSLERDCIVFDNHNFNDGDIVEYQTTGAAISGLSTTSTYYILKVDDSSFELADASVKLNYTRRNNVKLSSIGSGYHIFKYPDIQITVNVSYGSSIVGNIVATPVVKGKIVDAYLYEPGTGYGSEIINLSKKPIIRIKNGKNAEVAPIVKDGKIIKVQVLSGGSEYYSVPDLRIIGEGTGAILRPVISGQKLVEVVVIFGGTNYVQDTTTINVVSSGSGAILDSSIRSLTLNSQSRYFDENIIDAENNLQYTMVGYSANIGAQVFGDNGSSHSPIIGWAYDGNPIYGPYGYSNPESISSPVRLLQTGYVLDTSSVTNRPPSFASGFFVDDYRFNDSGDLDVHNGRFCKTPEFPNGTYAYFVGIATDTATNTLRPDYPYFIGNTYRSKPDEDNFILDQSFNFNDSNLIRNTFPYKVGDLYADNDFLIESNEIINQQTLIESISKGSVDSVSILESGDGYRIGENAVFDNTGTNGSGLSVEVSEIYGKPIESISTEVETHDNSVFVWKDKNTVEFYISSSNTLSNNEYLTVSGLSTSVLRLTGTHKIGVSTESVKLFKDISAVVSPGTVEDIYVSNIPGTVSVGSTITIGNEVLKVLNIYPEGSILRVRRSDTGTAHTSTTPVNIIPNKFEIPLKTEYFDSQFNSRVYFNPNQSVGVGTTTGGSSQVTYTVGQTSKNVSVPTQSIYLPNHPFKTGQRAVFVKKSGTTSLVSGNSPSGSTFNLPSGDSQTVYIINKSRDYIGLTTVVGLTTNTGGLYFNNNGSDNFEYYIEDVIDQVTGRVEKIKSTVSVSTSHGLRTGDIISLSVKPNQPAGIGNSSSVRVKYNQQYDKLLINPIGFTSAGINTASSQITLDATYLKTGDKVFYNSTDTIASGLTTGSYFVYKIDNSTIKLTETYYDTTSKYPVTVSITGIGGSEHTISQINPRISTVRGSHLTFDVSDSSLVGKEMKLFFDQDFNSEFISVGNTSTFNVVGFGTVGVSTNPNATFTLRYGDGLPSKVYYALQSSGYISTSDKEVKNHSEISFVDSAYEGTYSISGVGVTSFQIALNRTPESTLLYPSQYDTLQYSTTSTTTSGGIKKIKKIFGGYNYKILPKFVGFSTGGGRNALLEPKSNTIGKINKTRILNAGFEYSSDKTLKPEAFVSPIISITNSTTITDIDVIDGGKNYTSPPNLIIVDSSTGRVVNSDSLSCKLSSSSISSVEVVSQPYGLNSKQQNIIAIDNTNGVSISSITSSPTGIVTCVLSTPILGFSTSAFSVGDDIFVEGIEKDSNDGSGFNSSDYGYRFFKVSSYINTNPAVLEFSVAGLTTNAGLAKTNQGGYASIISRKNYPSFEVTQEFALFNTPEKLITDSGTGFFERDLYVTESDRNYIKISGTYQPEVGEVLKGEKSGVIATISGILENKGIFNIDYATRQEYGWTTDVGKLNESYQVTSDNDYYQNLAYSVRSTIGYEDLVNPVNRLLHTSGLKNFADTQINSKSDTRVSYGSTTNDIIVLDISDDKRVDSINSFGMTLDVDTASNPLRSKFLKFKNKKLSDYIKCVTNRVLSMDDISPRFSNRDSNQDLYTEIEFLEDDYSRYLIQVINPNNLDRELKEVVLLKNSSNVYVLEKGSLSNANEELGEIVGNSDTSSQTLRFIPSDPYNTDYDIKVLKNRFNSNINGIGTQSIGFINLTGSNKNVSAGTTETILAFETSNIDGLYASVQVTDSASKEMSYIELFLDHDGTNTYVSDLFFDTTDIQGVSTSYIGQFQPSISSGVLSLNYFNDQNSNVFVRSSIVGFGTTATGIGTYRFLAPAQPEGSEKSAIFESNYTSASGETTVIGINTSLISSVKSYVRVSYGQTSALHQVLMTQDGTDVYTTQYPFLSIGSTSGIGTFGGEITGSNGLLKFYPDPNITSNIQVQSFNQLIYFENDYINTPVNLDYGTATDLLALSSYDSVNGTRANRLDFNISYKGNPIYSKTFNPSNSTKLNLETGLFSVVDHFFSTGEELYYEPGSSFVGAGSTGVGIGATENYAGIVTSVLPPKVYAIKINNDQFKLATKREYAIAGIYVTFTSYGAGNSHTLEMAKKLEKTMISLNGVVQKPITFVPISYTLENNSGQVSAGTSFFSISGISTIKPRDIIKVDEEYMGIIDVGIGTNSSGPITGIGTFNVLQVQRGFVGSSATSHADGSVAQLYRGAYNISGSKIYFTEAPKGNPRQFRDQSNNLYPKTTFNGRVYLRNDYTTNTIYDDISDQFTGIGQTFTLTVQGINTTGVQTGSGVVFINDIFQTPTTDNNAGNNYELGGSSGISSVTFTGITSTNGQIIISEQDVNQNQLPRGGVIVSLGSTPGAGFAPLVGASVTAVLDGSGGIVSVGIGSTDIYGSGYYGNVSIGITDPNHTGSEASISAVVGAGGTLSFLVTSPGSGYVNPYIRIPEPSYENLSVIGISREGIGSTTETGRNLLVTLDVGAISTTGIGSTLFEVTSFKISRPGYGFKKGDRFKPVGLVTARGLSSPLEDFELTVLDVFNDSFSSWQFGELDFIDSIKNLQNGSRKRFPLYYNGQLLSFEKDPADTTSVNIDLNSVLLIFVNGVIQQPNVAYQFEGGTSFVFSDAPRSEDNVAIFFYRGTRGDDSLIVNVNETIKPGDFVEVQRNNLHIDTYAQEKRVIEVIAGSDKIQTNVYTGQGIDEVYYKPITWIKQKSDRLINGDYVSKSRDSIESQIYPTAKIIKDVKVGDTDIFVDDAQFFNYEENNYGITINTFDAVISQGLDPVSAGVTATVSAGGTISTLTITNAGYGYTSTPTIKISAPKAIGVGVGTTATASISISGGIVSSVSVVNPGFGYTTPPQVIVSYPDVKIETVQDVSTVQGFSGIITGITTTTGTSGHPLALKFFIQGPSAFPNLNINNPIYIKDTSVGTGLTSVYSLDSESLGIGTNYVDNIYIVHTLTTSGTNAEFTTNIDSNSNVIGIAVTGTSSSPVGRYSWGQISGLTRSSNPVAIGISGLTVDSGLSTFPNIQRRGFGLRDTGSIRKTSTL